MENEENKNESEDFKVVIREIKDQEFEKFQDTLNKELIIDLYKIFKIYEKKGLINYDIYMESMTEIFKKYNKSSNFKSIFDLIFNRFQKIKCVLKNNKTVFYLTEMVYKNAIETYIIVAFLTVIIKCRIFDKIKLLFKLTDNDDDGYLNKAEIKLMISTINFLFCENSEKNINSSILSQSLMNINVKEKINKLMNSPGNLGLILQKEKYVNFDIFFECLEKIPNYKYDIIPCFINIRKCLYNQRKEKILDIKNKNKIEFVRATSALSNTKPRGPVHLFKRNFSANLERLIKNVKKKKEEEIDFNNFSNNQNLIKKKQVLLGIKERNKSFKELLKESTILSDEENDEKKEKKKRKNLSRNNSLNPEYIFEADFDKIKKVEVEPGLLRFSNENIFNKKIKRYNSNANISLNSNIDKNSLLKNFRHKNTVDSLNNINFRNIQSAKNNNKIKGNNTFNFNLIKRSSIFPLSYKNNMIKNLSQFQTFNLNKRHNNSLKDFSFNKGSMEQILEKNNSKKNKSCFNKTKNKINNINIIEESNKINNKINKYFTPINNKKKVKIKFRNEKNFLKSSQNLYNNKNRKNIEIKNFKNFTYDKKKSNINKKNIFNKICNRNKNQNLSKNNLFSIKNNRFNKYLNSNEILKDLNDEEKLAHEKSYYLEKELVILYNILIKERSKIKVKMDKFNESDFSLSFYDLKEKLFPDSFGRKINSFHKIKLNNK